MICKENITTLGTNDVHHTFLGALTIILINQTKTIVSKCTETRFDHTTRILQLPLRKVLSDTINFKNKQNKHPPQLRILFWGKNNNNNNN